LANKWLPPIVLQSGGEYPFGNFLSLVTVPAGPPSLKDIDPRPAISIPPGSAPWARAAGNKIIVFGGKSNGYSNKVFEYYLGMDVWYRVTTTGTPPSPRYGHSAVFIPPTKGKETEEGPLGTVASVYLFVCLQRYGLK
jgi:hypothetical protein